MYITYDLRQYGPYQVAGNEKAGSRASKIQVARSPCGATCGYLLLKGVRKGKSVGLLAPYRLSRSKECRVGHSPNVWVPVGFLNRVAERDPVPFMLQIVYFCTGLSAKK
jgi:hypothetical protein